MGALTDSRVLKSCGGDNTRATMLTLTELIARAPWREAVTYRDTWPHEYVLSEKDAQQELLEAVCERFRAGEGVSCRFFRMNNTYLFLEEIAQWRGLVKAMEERREQGGAAVTYQGDMVDVAHEETARSMLEMARELGVLES